ncbi:MAG TPA: DUF177 domain-containing protein [Pseudolabrys sp.]|nr:DUF177 domain-containing protein [Pseudolabrys sp.]
MEKNQNPWTVPIAVDEIPEAGLHIEIDASEATRAELAALAGLRELAGLSAAFDLARRGSGVRVTGRVRARVGQTCVVTLEPVQSDLEELVDLVFAPQLAESLPAKAEAAERRASDEDPPEPLVGGKLDLGVIATEFLVLGIDPYPRKADAEFTQICEDDGNARPFAALEALKKRLGGS